MLPPVRALAPAASSIAETIMVTVDLPLEPVMAMTGARALSANNSMSPTKRCGVDSATPGLTTMRSNCANRSSGKPPVMTSTRG